MDMLRVGCGYSPSAMHVISTPSLSSIVFFVYIRSNFFSVAGTNEFINLFNTRYNKFQFLLSLNFHSMNAMKNTFAFWTQFLTQI